jgi:hypothetical protein
LKTGRKSVSDEERSGRPSTSRTENNTQAVERIKRESRRISVCDIAVFHIFGPMKEAVRGIRISCDEEVIGAMQIWVRDNKNFFMTELKKLAKCWKM